MKLTAKVDDSLVYLPLSLPVVNISCKAESSTHQTDGLAEAFPTDLKVVLNPVALK